MSMCKECIIDSVQSLEIKNKDSDIVVIKFNTNKFNIMQCQEIYREIINELPVGAHAIGIPIGIELERTTIEEMIKRLGDCRDGILH